MALSAHTHTACDTVVSLDICLYLECHALTLHALQHVVTQAHVLLTCMSAHALTHLRPCGRTSSSRQSGSPWRNRWLAFPLDQTLSRLLINLPRSLAPRCCLVASLSNPCLLHMYAKERRAAQSIVFASTGRDIMHTPAPMPTLQHRHSRCIFWAFNQELHA